jgi:hypothetical protein
MCPGSLRTPTMRSVAMEISDGDLAGFVDEWMLLARPK